MNLRVISLCVTVLIGCRAEGQEIPAEYEEFVSNDEIVVSHLQSTTLPVSKSFASYARIIAGLEREKTGYGVDEVQSALALKTESASGFVQLLVLASSTIQQRSDELIFDAACSGRTPKMVGSAAFDVLQQSYSLTNSAEQQVFSDFLMQLDPGIREKFLQVLELHKKNIGYVELDLKKIYSRKNLSADAILADMCLAAYEREQL